MVKEYAVRYVKAALTKQSAVSAGVGALLILILTSAVIASSMLQGGSARRAATSGSVGGIGSPSNAGSHVTFSLTPTAGTGAQSTPSVSPTPQAGPTGGPGGHHVDPGSPGNPGSGGGSSSLTPTAGPTVPPAPGVTPTPTNVPTPTLPEYDAKPVGPTTPVTVDNPVLNHFITLTVQNTGTATWKSPFGSNPGPFIYLHCLSDCGFDPDPFVTGPDVAPGQLFTYAYAYRVFPGATHHPHFMMEVNDVFIGPEMVLSVIDSTEMPVSTQQAPTCDNTAGASWVTLNAGGGNTIACTASGLLMQQGALASPEANLVSVTGLTPDNFDIHVHVHFADTTESAFAGFALRVQPQDTCGGYRFLVRPDGAFEIFIQFVTASGCTSAPPFLQGKVAASADFDLTYLESFGAGYWYLNHTVLGDGGVTTFTGVDGLTVLDSNNSASPVYFSQFSVNNQVPEYMQYWLSAP